MNVQIYTSDIFSCGYTFEDFIAYCDDMELEKPVKEDERYYEWLREELNLDFESIIDNIEHSKYNTKCLVSGSVGCWDGRHEIIPTDFETLTDAIYKCINDQYDFIITKGDDAVYIKTYHHDGSNNFKIVIGGVEMKDTFPYS